MKYTVTTTDQYHEVLFDLIESLGYNILQQFPKVLNSEELEGEIKKFVESNILGNS